MSLKEAWFAFSRLPLTPREKLDLLQRYGGPSEVFQNTSHPYNTTGFCEQFLILTDPGYPSLLKQIHDPPVVLFYRGTPVMLRCVAVVGTRDASLYGKKAAYEIAGVLAGQGYTVVSGMARGIDGCAHQGALSNGSTLAVLGNGIDVVYPREHAILMEDIAGAGCLISEYPPGVMPLPRHFPARNRIISGLCLCTVVIEAKHGSGSLITAEFALEQGREVLALPHEIYGKSPGTLRLIREGAVPITSMEELIQDVKEVEMRGGTIYD